VLEKKSSPFVMASDGPKSRPATNGLNPALKRGATPKNHTPNVNNTFLNFNNESGTYIPSIKPKPSQALIKMDTIDLKSKDELFSQMVQKSKVAKSTASTSSHKEASSTAKSKPRKLQAA
jgi:hypothetical protein